MAISSPSEGGPVQRPSFRGNARPGNGGMLLELIDRILDKGIVIDAWVRVSLLGIELLTVEARIVVASVDTYLKYAEAIAATGLASAPPSVNRTGPGQALPQAQTQLPQVLPQLLQPLQQQPMSPFQQQPPQVQRQPSQPPPQAPQSQPQNGRR